MAKRADNLQDHVIFVAVILLAALAYSYQSNHFSSNHLVSYAIQIGIALLAFFLLLKVVLKIRSARHVTDLSYSVMDTMSGIKFEQYVADLLPRLGYQHVRLTERYDYGLDIIAEKGKVRWGIQVKRQSYPVKIEAVRQAVAALKYYKCDRAMVITNSGFTHSAQQLAISNGCILVDRQQLYSWINL